MSKTVDKVISDEQYICLKCGSALMSDSDFCSKCGTKRGEKNNKKCVKCGAVLDDSEKFCPKCGEKAHIDIVHEASETIKNISRCDKKKKIKYLIIVCLFVILAIFLIIFGPKIFVSVDDLLTVGNYAEAYDRADDAEKSDILEENLIAYLSKEIPDGLKDRESFVLRDAWYDKSGDRIVIEVNGNNSYGAKVVNYYYYTLKEAGWELYVTLSSLEEETIYYYIDDSYEIVEKLLENAARRNVIEVMEKDECKISDESVDRINLFFENDILDDIKLLEKNQITSNNKSL